MKASRWPLLTCLAVGLAGGVSAALVAPSDLELTTVYCIGVLKNRLALHREHPDPAAGDPSALFRDLERLGNFIGPRLGSLDSTTLAIARRRANDDFMRWYADAKACRGRCVDPAGRPDRDSPCRNDCSHDGAAYERMQACETIDWLPP